MRAHFTFPPLPRHPLLRVLAVVGAAIVLTALVATGLVLGAFALAAAALVLATRRWLSRRAPRTTDPSIIEGEFTVVPPQPRAGLPRPE
ncbi:MAG: hypothetical protein KGJ46_11340 [Xanthomonadaceae bacterium]|nr:hypothetical protein [Xanthomonadaceae bacterium]